MSTVENKQTFRTNKQIRDRLIESRLTAVGGGTMVEGMEGQSKKMGGKEKKLMDKNNSVVTAAGKQVGGGG